MQKEKGEVKLKMKFYIENTTFVQNPLRSLLLSVFCISLFFLSCSTANYGKARRNPEVKQAFEAYQVNPEYVYYYLNQENNPYAVAGILRKYQIRSHYWQPVDPQTEKFEKVVGLITHTTDTYYYLYGYDILNSEGSLIGVFYSGLSPPRISVDEETKTVSINTQTPWLRDERDFRHGRGGGIRIGL